MTGTRLGMCVLLLAAVAVSGVWVLAGDDDALRQDDPRNVEVDRDDDRDDDRPRDDRRRDSEAVCDARWVSRFRELLPTVDHLQTQEADEIVGFLSRA